MRYLITIILLFAVSLNLSCQVLEIEWQNTIGGDFDETSPIIRTTPDKGCIVGGTSNSGISGDKSLGCFGNTDFWLIKLDSQFNIIWQIVLGGTGIEVLGSLSLTQDNGFIVGGTSSSGISGNKTEGVIGDNDYWIVKLDSIGNIEWQNTIGGFGTDILNSVSPTTDRGYILGGYSNSPISGDKTESNEMSSDDYWVIKLDSVGNIEWQNNIGGNGQDWLYSLSPTDNGGYIVSGRSNSGISGEKTEPSIGGEDIWILKLDSIGNIEWQNTIGGSISDWGFKVRQTQDGGFVVGGLTNSSISGDKIENSWGGYDYWIVKLDSTGIIQWQNDIGGNQDDILIDFYQTPDEGFILSGYSSSGISGDKLELSSGLSDYWIVKLDNIGNIILQETFGGWSEDHLSAMNINPDGSFLFVGFSASPASGDKIEDNIGSSDFWVIKTVKDTCEKTIFYADIDIDGFGNSSDTISGCFAPFGYVADSSDCNDIDNTINPPAIELCNNVDENCNTMIDEGLPLFIYFTDNDLDTYGDITHDTVTCADTAPIGYSANSTDCDDDNGSINEYIHYYYDGDSDSYGTTDSTAEFCLLDVPTGFSMDSTDCNDQNPNIYPGAEEIENEVDDNCNQLIDEYLIVTTKNDFVVTIYPNPNNGIFQIKSSIASFIFLQIQITDVCGRIILEQEIDPNVISTIVLPDLFFGIANVAIYSNESKLNFPIIVFSQ